MYLGERLGVVNAGQLHNEQQTRKNEDELCDGGLHQRMGACPHRSKHVRESRLRGVTGRWRGTGYAQGNPVNEGAGEEVVVRRGGEGSCRG